MAGYDRSLIRDHGEVESGFPRRSLELVLCRMCESRGRNRKAADRDSAPHFHCPTVDRGDEHENTNSRRGLCINPSKPSSRPCELSSHSMCHSMDVRRMQDLLMILGAPSCSVVSPTSTTLRLRELCLAATTPAVAGAHMRTRAGSHITKIHTCRLTRRSKPYHMFKLHRM